MEKGLVIVVSGPSGVGKGSVTKKLIASCKNLELTTSVTTRAPRPMEVNGVDYYFCSPEEFQRRIDNDEFIEYATVHGNMYGTLVSEVEKSANTGRDVILEIDVQGGKSVQEKLPDSVSIFLLPPSLEELSKRLIGRETDAEEVIRSRLQTAITEINCIVNYDYVVINDDLQTCMNRIKSIIKSEKHRVSRQKETVIQLLEGGTIS